MLRRMCQAGLAGSMLLAVALAGLAADTREKKAPQGLILSEAAQAVPSTGTVMDSFKSASPFKAGGLNAADRKAAKGLGLTVYPKVAPAVVLVRSAQGNGTGFLIDPAGWIITNNHVVADALPDTGATGALQVKVHLGQLKDGQMEVIKEGVSAHVYKRNRVKDLALLKLDSKPEGITDLPTLAISDGPVKAGVDCVAIGHPAAGVLWTMRSGEVSAVSLWPRDRKDVVLSLLGITRDQDRKEAEEALARAEPVRVVLSSCRVNPGDSGGPLVDRDGKVIAVTFARPSPRDGVELNAFSFHIHRDDLKEFVGDLARQPATPPPDVPEALPRGVYCEIRRLGDAEAMLFGDTRGAPPTGVLLDLKGSNSPLSADDLADPAKRAAWKYQFALHRSGPARAFYDTDGDGRIDLILMDTDRDGRADMALRLADGQWKVDKARGQGLVDARNFENRDLQERFERLVPAFQKFLAAKRD
jgi:S1-C subfamily serine protease